MAVTIFLLAGAVLVPRRQKTPDGYYNVERMLKRVLSRKARCFCAEPAWMPFRPRDYNGPAKEYRMSEPNFDQKFVERGELRERLKRRERLLVINVRSAEELASGHIDGAVNIPMDQLAGRHGEVPNK